ncbi:minor capsid protein [Bacillus sp. 3255]|uniref:minor capsid protein n=1 Tax=Bacillus sp. 3255 TaxID=2817904 RepID=UPI002857E0A3|nr:minor capsid protein [Bacillus sp. 3255]MDR6883031.1 SPP1 gp7 family putative phage head morphogenesis protein [Bacillus sp. 3255]
MKDEMPIVSYAESPSLYVFEQFKVATDRISTIRDVQQLVKADLRFRITNNRLATDATRGGFKIIVSGSDADRARLKKQGKSLKRVTPGANVAQAVIDDFLKRTKLPAKAKEYARVLPRDGDLFLNPIVDLQAGLVLDIRRAPALTIKRNSDEFGEFPDLERSFSQIDPKTQIQTLLEVGPPSVARTNFALFQMNHIRWLEEETEMYGTSHYASARATYKILNKMEIASAVRREFRSVQKYNHKLPENTQEKDAIEYMRLVGLIDKNDKPTRNAHLLSDFVGTADVKVLDADGHLDQMNDIKYFEDLLWLNLSVPKAILTSGQDMNRDVLKVQYPHYLKTLEDLTDLIEYGDSGQFSGLRAIVDLQLLLAGINPDSITYDVVWNDKTDETAAERLERVQQARGKGGGQKLITLEKAIQEIADDFDIEDPAEMAALLEEEERQKQAEMLLMGAGKAPNDKTQPSAGKTPVKGNEAVTDVLLEDRPEFEEIETKARATVTRFFNSVYKRMVNESEAISDAAGDENDFIDESTILGSFEEAWDAEQGSYRLGIVKHMTETGLMGAERAVQLVMDLHNGRVVDPSGPQTGAGLSMRIVKTDIRDDLFEAAGERIAGIRETTKIRIQQLLGQGFEENLGWKEIMRQLRPQIMDNARAEMIARTELSWAYNRSAKRIYLDAGFERVKWLAVIDQRTCPNCRSRNGTVYPIDSHPDIPGHPRCRCTLVPAD